MSQETMSLDEFEHYDKGVKATIKRISAENTWLRHNYGELEKRVDLLKKDITVLRKAATKIKKSIGITARKEPKTRSPK